MGRKREWLRVNVGVDLIDCLGSWIDAKYFVGVRWDAVDAAIGSENAAKVLVLAIRAVSPGRKASSADLGDSLRCWINAEHCICMAVQIYRRGEV
jgi:hypothetical protein